MNKPATETIQPLAPEGAIQTLTVVKQRSIDASIEIVWESMLEEMGPAGLSANEKPMPMKLEAWPGGRWFRDLGEREGHLWGHVQVIKPPKLLEICGPLFMSYPGVNHVQYRLTAEGNSTWLKLTHRGFGLIDPDHAKGVNTGWEKVVQSIAKIAERRKAKL